MIIEYKTGKRVIKARPIRYDNKFCSTAFPNPVQLFLSSAIDNYNLSEEVRLFLL
jgi:hypothetical protein